MALMPVSCCAAWRITNEITRRRCCVQGERARKHGGGGGDEWSTTHKKGGNRMNAREKQKTLSLYYVVGGFCAHTHGKQQNRSNRNLPQPNRRNAVPRYTIATTHIESAHSYQSLTPCVLGTFMYWIATCIVAHSCGVGQPVNLIFKWNHALYNVRSCPPLSPACR